MSNFKKVLQLKKNMCGLRLEAVLQILSHNTQNMYNSYAIEKQKEFLAFEHTIVTFELSFGGLLKLIFGYLKSILALFILFIFKFVVE